ncbi:hypothetical protein VTJ04DRAFT_5070 [Mycothermus thermophilus]|uniref:uncharacterized protein n=1 Tax=Humicola insolens TaxID=85995 RepID=UPI0037443F7F
MHHVSPLHSPYRRPNAMSNQKCLVIKLCFPEYQKTQNSCRIKKSSKPNPTVVQSSFYPFVTEWTKTKKPLQTQNH